MAADVHVFDVTVPPGGSAAVPQRFPLTMPARRVTGVEIVIPAGVRGVVHFALGSTGTNIVPSNYGAYLAGDGEKIAWPLSNYIDSGSWELAAYNTGRYPHTLEIRFLLELVQSTVSNARQPFNPALLGG
jgi:hypothetical protein